MKVFIKSIDVRDAHLTSKGVRFDVRKKEKGPLKGNCYITSAGVEWRQARHQKRIKVSSDELSDRLLETG